jgi:hypothetical protein
VGGRRRPSHKAAQPVCSKGCLSLTCGLPLLQAVGSAGGLSLKVASCIMTRSCASRDCASTSTWRRVRCGRDSCALSYKRKRGAGQAYCRRAPRKFPRRNDPPHNSCRITNPTLALKVSWDHYAPAPFPGQSSEAIVLDVRPNRHSRVSASFHKPPASGLLTGCGGMGLRCGHGRGSCCWWRTARRRRATG